jgi:hypothetical protein
MPVSTFAPVAARCGYAGKCDCVITQSIANKNPGRSVTGGAVGREASLLPEMAHRTRVGPVASQAAKTRALCPVGGARLSLGDMVGFCAYLFVVGGGQPDRNLLVGAVRRYHLMAELTQPSSTAYESRTRDVTRVSKRPVLKEATEE